MGWRERLRKAPAAGGRRVRGMEPEVLAHLEAFAGSRRGVEAYVEPVTAVQEMTIVLVATDGEWTRKRIPDARSAGELGASLGIPVYDVHATGYPPRMREWSARQKRGEAQPQSADDAVLAALEKDLLDGPEP